jgi:hypothetical protein
MSSSISSLNTSALASQLASLGGLSQNAKTQQTQGGQNSFGDAFSLSLSEMSGSSGSVGQAKMSFDSTSGGKETDMSVSYTQISGGWLAISNLFDGTSSTSGTPTLLSDSSASGSVSASAGTANDGTSSGLSIFEQMVDAMNDFMQSSGLLGGSAQTAAASSPSASGDASTPVAAAGSSNPLQDLFNDLANIVSDMESSTSQVASASADGSASVASATPDTSSLTDTPPASAHHHHHHHGEAPADPSTTAASSGNSAASTLAVLTGDDASETSAPTASLTAAAA